MKELFEMYKNLDMKERIKFDKKCRKFNEEEKMKQITQLVEDLNKVINKEGQPYFSSEWVEKDLLVSPKQATKLKQLGFDEPCLFGYNQDDEDKLMIAPQLSSYDINSGKNSDVSKINKVTAPIRAQVFKWFRDEYGLNGDLYSQLRPSNKFMYGFKIGGSDAISDGFHTYEETELACIDKLIEIVRHRSLL